MSPSPAIAPQKDFTFLDQKEFYPLYAQGQNLAKVRFHVDGIHCSKCIRKLEGLIETTPGLEFARVEMGKNILQAEVDTARLPLSRLAELIVEKGFKPTPLTHDMQFNEAEQRAQRLELIRLAVAGACAGNIMTFAFATYFGEPDEWTPVFQWISFALYIPVLTYVALPFYRNAWNSIRQGQISIDLPMAIASLAGFAFSTVELLRGHDDIYFDSLSGFLFLILLSRWMQRSLQKRFLRSEEFSESLQLQRVRILEKGLWSWRPLNRLKVDDEFVLFQNESLPADAELISNSGFFSLAWLSGEAKPKTLNKGSTVPAGARLVSNEAKFIARRSLHETGFGQILDEVNKFSLAQNRVIQMTDRWAQWLLAIVFTVAILFLVGYWHIDPQSAIQRSLALVILACPCAMAFGTPLALAAALKKARRAGLLVKDANVFEEVRQVDTIFFDKTGTLTDSHLTLVGQNLPLSDSHQRIILALENESFHPIAFAFREALTVDGPLPAVVNLTETPGRGVSGTIKGHFYAIESDGQSQDAMSCALKEDGQVIGRFQFAAQIRPQAAAALAALRQRGFQLKILSGDQKKSVQNLAEQLGFSASEIFDSTSPFEKSQIVSENSNAMMVGDGINDSLALMNARVGVAVSGGVESALKSAKVYMIQPELSSLLSLFKISDEAHILMKQNLTLSILYNSVGGTLALLGFINPLIAALLMPLSSGVILLNSWRRGRS